MLKRDSFNNFISFVRKNFSGESHQIIFTYVQEIETTNQDLYQQILNKQKKYFYWNKPSENFSFIAIGKVYSFDPSTKQDNPLTIKNISNAGDIGDIALPLLAGSKKFPLSEKGTIWDDFSDSEWFIPKFILLQNSTQNLLAINFSFTDVKHDDFIEEWENELSQIFNNNSLKNYSKQSFINSITHTESEEFDNWNLMINTALERISTEQFQKVVLARYVKADVSIEPPIGKLLQELEEKFPECYIFAYRNGNSLFFGASPEKLLKIKNGVIETDALAGSIERGSTIEEDEQLATQLSNSQKNISEHKSVLDYIVLNLSEISSEVEFEPTPYIKKLGNIQHLWTPIKAKLKPGLSIIDAMEKLYPTPAICGYPKDEALQTIYELESFDRGLYSGVIGWLDKNYQGEFAIAIRSALLVNKTLFAFAGCGIVEGSDSLNEFKETELKLNPILSLFKNETINQS